VVRFDLRGSVFCCRLFVIVDAARFIQPGVIEDRICECAPSQRGRVGVIFEAKKISGGRRRARRRLAGSFAPKKVLLQVLLQGGLPITDTF